MAKRATSMNAKGTTGEKVRRRARSAKKKTRSPEGEGEAPVWNATGQRG
jgi:hypothetical protein